MKFKIVKNHWKKLRFYGIPQYLRFSIAWLPQKWHIETPSQVCYKFLCFSLCFKDQKMTNLSRISTDKGTKKMAIARSIKRTAQYAESEEHYRGARLDAYIHFQKVLEALIKQFGNGSECLPFPVTITEHWSEWRRVNPDPIADRMKMEIKDFILLFELPTEAIEFLQMNKIE